MSAAAEKPKLKRYRITWRICGWTDVFATSEEEAALKFEREDLSAEDMIRDGYENIEIDDPEEEDERRERSKA